MSGPISVTYTHESIARWLIANPGRSLRECADFVGYSPAWLSQVIHSDAFQAYYRKLSSDANALVIVSAHDRLTSLADAALEKLEELVDGAQTSGTAGLRDREFVKDTADMVLSRLGYGAKNPSSLPAQPPSHIHVERMVVNNAIQAMGARFRPEGPDDERGPIEVEVEISEVEISGELRQDERATSA